ncbi:amidase domain-containing protein [Streptomyces sp. JNUCC 64]
MKGERLRYTTKTIYIWPEDDSNPPPLTFPLRLAWPQDMHISNITGEYSVTQSRTLSTFVAAGITLASVANAGITAAQPSGSGTAPPAVSDATKKLFGDLAQAVIERRTAALLDAPAPAALNSPLATRTKGPVHLSAATARAENAIVNELSYVKQDLAEVPEAYTAAQTTTAVDSVSVTGNTATATVTESTMLTYKQITGSEPPNTEFASEHRFTYALGSDGTWALTTSEPIAGSGPSPINQVVVDPADLDIPVPPDEPTVEDGTEDPNDLPETPPDTGEKVVDIAGPTPASGSQPTVKGNKVKAAAARYDYGAMTRYAEKHWKNYNPAYRKFNERGGDCTNFVSQALRAGGWKNKRGFYRNSKYWWYNSYNQTFSWTGVDHWATFAKKSGRTSLLSNPRNLSNGDVLQVDFDRRNGKDHTMMVTYRPFNGQPYLTYHSTDTKRRSLGSILRAYPNAKYYAHRT